MKKTTLYLPDELQLLLKEAARRTGQSEATVVREALARYLEQIPRPLPQSIGAGEDPEVAARDSEDWLRAHWDAPGAQSPVDAR
jgi:hypothetical protein